MLTEKMTTFKVEDREIPIICTFNVLEYLQKEYKTISRYQAMLLGMPEDKEKNNEEQTGVISLKAMIDGATAMINEGLAVKGENEQLTREEVGVLLRAAELTIQDVSLLVINELIGCIEPKKAISAQGEKKGKKPLSTLRGFFTWGRRS